MCLVTATFLSQWFLAKGLNPILFAISIVLSLQVAVLAHNHHHARTWKIGWLNAIHSYWLTVFYGLPELSWMAVHNHTHHAHGNKPMLDCTSTHNVDDRNNLVGLLRYAPASTAGFYRVQGLALARYWRKSRLEFAYQVSHIVVLFGVLGALAVVDWKKTLLYARRGARRLVLVNFGERPADVPFAEGWQVEVASAPQRGAGSLPAHGAALLRPPV